MKSPKINQLFHNNVFKCALLCFFLSFISFIYFIAIGDGFFIVRDDFNEQQIPFTVGLHNSLLDGGLGGWSWSSDLGGSTLQVYGFYELGSPFFWITMLFGAQAFPYLVGWLYMLKYTVAGVLAFLFLRRFLTDEKWAILGAVLYAFSGFSTTDLLFYHFHDAVALFPLLLIGLDILIEKHDFRLFVVAVFLNALLNYYFFIGEVVFLVFYYLFRFTIANDNFEFKRLINDFFRCLGCGVLGVGMAAVLFIPGIAYISGNSRASASFDMSSLFYNLRYLLYVIKGIFLPAESMPDLSSVFSWRFYSAACYLPMLGMVFVLAYVIKRRDWLSRFMIFLLVATFFPIIGNVFYLYADNQMRWWYMMVLMMALASCRLLEEYSAESNKAIKISLIVNVIVLAAFFVLVAFVAKTDEGESLIFDSRNFAIYYGLAIFGIICCFILVHIFKCHYNLTLLGVCGFAVATTFLTMYVYRTNGRPVDYYARDYEVACQIKLPDEQYRLNTDNNVYTMVNDQAGFSAFTSTNANSIVEFEDLFDYYSPTLGIDKNIYDGLAELLGGKYYIVDESSEDSGEGTLVTSYFSNDGVKYLLMETDACPIGFGVDSVISVSELKKIPVEKRAIVLLSAAVVDNDDADSLVSSIDGLSLVDSATADLTSEVSDLVAANTKKSVSNFTKDGHGFSCNSAYDKDTLIYFSVPNDEGWTASIDGHEAEIINSGGMMLLSVPAGEHEIKFSYETPYYRLGLWVSIVSIMVFVCACLYYKKKS